jgi:hypothetical protein
VNAADGRNAAAFMRGGLRIVQLEGLIIILIIIKSIIIIMVMSNVIKNAEACASFDKRKFKDSAADRMLRLVVEMLSFYEEG